MLIKQRPKKPALSVPDARPLSPCIIHPCVGNADVKEENKGYVPVSLLMRAIVMTGCSTLQWQVTTA